MSNVSDKDLKNELHDIQERYPKLKDDELFVVWFLKCFVVEKEEEAVAALVGGKKDKSLDAIHVDEQSKSVFIVQGKYRTRNKAALEKRTDVAGFAELANTFIDKRAFASFLEGLDAAACGKAEEAEKRIRTRGYNVQLYYVTTGRCSETLQKEAERIAGRGDTRAKIEIIDGKRTLLLLSDYLDGVAPPVPMLELEIESGNGVKLDGVLQRFDGNTRIESWVIPVNVRNIAEMYEQSGVRLFARNVRGFLGDTPVNRSMEETLDNEPAFFWYYNNGITIVCDHAEQHKRAGRSFLQVLNPQIINGQQTTRTLFKKARSNTKASVLVRVISVPRDREDDSRRFEYLISKIVAATNWQNTIRASDLMANDRRQIEIERNLRKLDYQYLRKRQTKGEARRNAGVRHRFFVSKEEVAQAVAACDLDPSVVREGKERLFEERLYNQVFPNADPNYYLPRFLLVSVVASVARGYPERAYAKWLVTHFVWQRLNKVLRTRNYKDAFIREAQSYIWESLLQACNEAYRGVMGFYRARRGKGDKAIDVSTFFQRRGLHDMFERYWRVAPGKFRRKFNRSWNKFLEELDELANAE